MSHIDDLIRDLCPDGVEFRTLEEIFETRNGYTPSKNDPEAWAGNDVPWFRMDDIRSRGRILRDATQRISTSAVKGDKTFPAGSILVATSATIGEHALVQVPHLSNQRFTNLAIKDNFKNSFDIKFLFYYCFKLDEWCTKNTTTSSFASVDMKGFKKFKFPIPPLEVQQEVAKTLDQFTQLEAELEAELEARQQQYAYYRDILVAPRSPRESVKLGEVSHIARGASPRPIRKFITNNDGIPWIKIGDVPPQGKYITATAQHISTDGAEKSRQIKPGDFILSNSMSFGRPYISKINGCIHDGWLVISNYETTFDPDFLYHVLRSSPIQNEFAQRAGSGTVRNLNSKIVSETLVPAPPIDQQREVVHLLDKFDLLVNDLTSGLPAEIEARRKQYEYYRDRLLTFSEKK